LKVRRSFRKTEAKPSAKAYSDDLKGWNDAIELDDEPLGFEPRILAEITRELSFFDEKLD
jgi:hypothetical protein